MGSEVKWYCLSPQQAEEKLNTNIAEGLTSSEIKDRHQKYGFNELKEKKL